MVSESVGWLAASLTLLAFSQRSMLPLRLAAIGSNLSFISYGIMAHLYPVTVLHVLLLPCNAFRLIQLLLGSVPRRAMPDRAASADNGGEQWEFDRAELQRQICQPLTAAMLYSQILAEKIESGPEREAVQGLLRSIGAIEQIIALTSRECARQRPEGIRQLADQAILAEKMTT